MKKIIASLGFLLVMSAVGLAAPNWDITGTWALDFNIGGGDYLHTMIDTMDVSTGAFSGTGTYNPNPAAYTWVVTGHVVGDKVDFHILYTGTGNPGYTVDAVGTIASDGLSMSGEWAGGAGTWTATGTATPVVCGTVKIVDLFAGKTIDAGDVQVWNNGNYLYVKYLAVDGWMINETHVSVKTAWADIPQAKGNAIPGQFVYNNTHDPLVTEYEYKIDLGALGYVPGQTLYVAAHAKLQKDLNNQTAWGAGTAFPGKNWAMYFDYVVQACSEACQMGVLWMVGTDDPQGVNPAAEFNYVEGVTYPAYTTPFVVGATPLNQFPWVSDPLGPGPYATNIDVWFGYAGPVANAKLTVGWSPGASSIEQKQIALTSGSGTWYTPIRPGVYVAGWFKGWQVFDDQFSPLVISPGINKLNFKQLMGDGAVWDYLKLEILDCPVA